MRTTFDIRFERRGTLGQGGMGAVERAYDRFLGREVALKVAHRSDHGAGDDARVAAEFGLLASLDHPGVVRVHDLGRADGKWWMSSELVSGTRLDRWLLDEPGAAAVDAVVGHLLDTLGWLHARGLVHGDLKPANILVARLGDEAWPVLIDFGLAGAFGAGGQVLGGTRAYLAPELLRAGAPSPRTDLYALGVALETARGAVSEGFTRLVAACRELDPDARPASCEAAARLIGRASGQRLGARDAATLWGDAVAEARGGLTRGSHTIVRLPGAGDAAPFARAVAAGEDAFVIDGALGPWARLATCFGAALEAPEQADPNDQREVLDGFADAVVRALDGQAPRVVVVAPERMNAAARFVLARVLEARVLGAALLVTSDALKLERGASDALNEVIVAKPDLAALTRHAAAYGVVVPDDPTAHTLLAAAAELGTGALRALFEAGFDDASTALWPRVWQALPSDARAVARTLHAVGEARASALGPGLAALAEAGLVMRDEHVRLIAPFEAAAAAFMPPLREDERARCVALASSDTELAAAALGRLLVGHDHARARGAFARAAELAAKAFDWAASGRHALAAARVSERQEAFRFAAQALAALRAAGGGPALEEALTVAEAAADGPEARLLRARARLELGQPKDALLICDALRADAASTTWPARSRAELALVRGTACAREGRRAEARIDLDLAMKLAEGMGDLHAVGRVANNLGILAFHDGDLDAAADAWARAARAKAATGDRRGQRIGLANRGLALRELGRYVEAWRAAEEASALARQIGDMVGRATGHLALAQLALDLGVPERAAAELVDFDAAPWRPALVRGDGENVRTRLDLARGDRRAAATRARATLDDAFEAAVKAEAGALLLVADPDAIVDAPPYPNAAGGLAILADAARVLVAARQGRWSDARPLLHGLVARYEHPAPAATLALGALIETADLLDLPEVEAALGAAAGLTVARRAEAARIVLDPPPSLADLTRALALESAARFLHKPAAAPVEAQPEAMLTTNDIALAQVLAQLAGEALLDPAAWARAARRVAEAARCELHVPGLAPSVDLERADVAPRARFADLAEARRLPFEAREPNGTFEALGVALEHSGGALFWGWGPGRGPRDVRALGAIARVCDVAIALSRTRADRDKVAERLAKVEAAYRDEVTSLREALEQSQSALELRYEYGGVVHRSPGMRRVLETLDKVTDRDLPVLVLGESGVGKELVARALHLNGPRKKGRFVAENCGAIPKDLFESQFFGHVKGAFTGALAPRQGLFEQADGGTLFLDEVGELPLDHQVKLLRVLQERVVRPVGSAREIPVDFRLVAATNRDLEQLVREGKFREDLFYRLAVVRVTVPPLRERKDDIVPIAEHLLELHAGRLGKRLKLTPEAADKLQAHVWPGNVRELENEVMRALALCDGDAIKARHFSPLVQRAGETGPKSEPRRTTASTPASGVVELLEVTLARVEKDALINALRVSDGQKAKASRLLGLSRPGLDAKLARHGIDARSLKRGPT